ncbi:MAG: extracellular solute-binding protein [Solirubrobacteraceae bacterium]
MTEQLTRRRFLTVAGAGATMLATAGCGATYDIAGGFVSPASGTNNHTLIYWNLLSGGDGANMQTMEGGFRKKYPHQALDSTVLQWGNPYYTKLAMSIRAGSPPDLAIMHLDRLPGFVPAKLLAPYDLGQLAAHGMRPSDFTPLAFRNAQFGGRQMALPLDTHPIVQYYNTKICKKAGLLDSSGRLPPITGQGQLLAVLRKLKAQKVTPVICDQINDPATAWRLFYTFYAQAGGKVLADQGRKVVLDRALSVKVLSFIEQLAREGLMDANVDANGGVAVFSQGTAGMYWEGEWNVTTFQSVKLPFDMQPFPAVFGPGQWADSHCFVMPVQPNHDPERTSMVLSLIRTLLGQSLTWAAGGHIPAWLPTRHSAAYHKLKPQSNYASAANHAIYDPPAWYSGAGSNIENYVGGAVAGVMTGATSPAACFDEMHSSLVSLSQQAVPV